jgi:hypothetical protein
MTFIEKAQFWKKKKDDFGSLQESPLPGDSGMPRLGDEPDKWKAQEEFELKPSAPPAFSSQPQTQQYDPGHDMLSKNIEIISAKIDALRAAIESMNQRLANIERIADESRKKSW